MLRAQRLKVHVLLQPLIRVEAFSNNWVWQRAILCFYNPTMQDDSLWSVGCQDLGIVEAAINDRAKASLNRSGPVPSVLQTS